MVNFPALTPGTSGCASGCLRGARVRRRQAEAGRKLLGTLQRLFALFETGAMIPQVICKGWIALDSLATAGTFFPLEGIAELYHTSSSLWLSLVQKNSWNRPFGGWANNLRLPVCAVSVWLYSSARTGSVGVCAGVRDSARTLRYQE